LGAARRRAAEAARELHDIEQAHAAVQLRMQHHRAVDMPHRRRRRAPHHAHHLAELQDQPERDDRDREHKALPAVDRRARDDADEGEGPAEDRIHRVMWCVDESNCGQS
jgi:hypothetical protein